MNQEKKGFDLSTLNFLPQHLFVVLLSGVCLASFSLFLIAVRLAPISRSARNWNLCVDTTSSYLVNMPSFQSVENEGIEAMSVSLCNGSTPQRIEQPSSEE